MSFVIDIKTRFLPEDVKTYMVFPGSGYGFYSEIKEKSAVFLDIPAFPMPEQTENTNFDDFVERLILSERVKDWHRKQCPADNPPARSLDDLGRMRRTKRRVQLAGLIRNFYYNVKKGDIIIVPPRNFDDDVLFGEIIDDAPTNTISINKYPDEKVPARKVKWVAKVKRSKIPGWLERKIGTPNAVKQVEFSFYPAIFDIMYERYVYKDQFVSTYAVTSDEFSSVDDLLFQSINLYVAALYEHNNSRVNPEIATGHILSLVANTDFLEAPPSLRVNIQSPGNISVYAKTVTPIIAAALIALCAAHAIATPTPQQNGQLPTIEIVNSIDNSQVSEECKADVRREVLDDLNVMGYDRWQQLCEMERRTREKTGLSTGMGVRKTETENTVIQRGTQRQETQEN